ncbi:MAG TPA: RNA-processing protein [Candidatus Bathyarchaeota archaeon]|nr:RNA-processing protein [Candidatus Bathyarchaeota archaeon]
MEARFHVKIPKERIGVLIGPGGSVRRRIEEALGVKLRVDSRSGDVEIALKDEEGDVSKLYQALNVVRAIGRGFSPERAFRLFDEDMLLDVIDLREYVGKSENALRRVKGRIIGRDGKTRRLIEELTGVYVSVYGHTVSLIGGFDQLLVAREAVTKLIKGSQHKTVYNYLFRAVRDLKRRRKTEIWEGMRLL